MNGESGNNLCVKYSQKNGKGVWDFNYAFVSAGQKVIPLSYVLNSHKYSGIRPHYLLEQKYKRDRNQKRKNDFRHRKQKCLAAVCVFVLFLSSVVYAKNVIRAAFELNAQTRKYDLLQQEMNQNVLNAFKSQNAGTGE